MIDKKNYPYTDKELFESYTKNIYGGEYRNEIAFPIGGIGTGCISLSGKGELVDWEIFNRPNKNYRPRNTFFSLWMRSGKSAPLFRVLESRLSPSFSRHLTRFGGTGAAPSDEYAAGLVRMESTEFIDEFPFGTVHYLDDDIPLEVSLEGFNPFIPLNDKDSSIPVAIFHVEMRNPSNESVEATVALNVENMLGYTPPSGCCSPISPGRTINSRREEKALKGIFMESEKFPPHSPQFGNLALGAMARDVTYQVPWLRGEWWDGLQHFCNTFLRTGEFDNSCDTTASGENVKDIVSLGVKVHLEPGQSTRVPFLFAWYIPNFERYWEEWHWEDAPAERKGQEKAPITWKNYYATVFDNAWDVLSYTADNIKRLYEKTQAFKKALYTSSLPHSVLDAIGANIATLKTPTCIRLEDGSLYGFEGCCGTIGCCVGTCTHVWNYAQALPYLFPALERSIRENEFRYSVRDEDGHMRFRMKLPRDKLPGHNFHAAVDGQLGSILKLYREWLLCGNDDWLREQWDAAKKALEYAWNEWDSDRDGIIDGLHHNTYDIEFIGAEPLANSFYLAALKAAAKIAAYLGEQHKAEEYEKIFRSGSAKMDDVLFNGEYYIQAIDDPDAKKYQYGDGCLSDQLIGQWFADMLRLGNLTSADNIERALQSIFRYNRRSSFQNFNNPQRVFAMNDEAGLLLCGWEHCHTPRFPLVYGDEVWSGIEYQVACCMVYHGMVREAMCIVKGARERHNGKNRNPYNEVECGNHYARAMASFGLLPALSGYFYSAPDRHISFSPAITPEDFGCFFSTDSGWGTFRQEHHNDGWSVILKLYVGALELESITLGTIKQGDVSPRCTIDNREVVGVKVVSEEEGITLNFPNAIKIENTLHIRNQR